MTHLFHNDSLEEAFNRRDLYSAACDLVEALLDNAHLSKLVTERTFDAIRAHPTVPSTTYTIFPETDASASIDQTAEFDGASVSESLDNILMACESLTNAAAAMPKVYKDKRSREMLEFARRIQDIGMANVLSAASTLLSPSIYALSRAHYVCHTPSIRSQRRPY